MAATEINFTRASFVQSAPSLRECPQDLGLEVAFAGRSNAGKSSAINALTRQSKLARISKTPGRTQLINFFAVTEHVRLVDLPGYGYAKVPLAVKREWDRHLSDYLQCRHSLRGLVLLMDIRHPLQEFDRQMLRWAKIGDLPVHILLTKADKLKRGPGLNVLQSVQKELEKENGRGLVSMQLFSALKHQGIEELEAQLRLWLLEADDREA